MQQAIARRWIEARGPRRAASAALLCAALTLASCDDAPDPAVQQAEARRLASAEPPTVSAALARLDEFAMLRRALAISGHQPLLRGTAPVTLFAPRDTAFAQLSAEQRAALLAEANRPALTRAIDGLIVPRAIRADELRQMIADGGGSTSLATRAGAVTITQDNGLLILTTASGARASLGSAEIATGNGLIYVLDRWPTAPSP